MNDFSAMLWVEFRKASRSRLPIFTTIGALFMPCAIAFMIYLSKNPELLERLGMVAAKANLIAYSATDWASYLNLSGQLIAVGAFFFFVLIISWIFGREFTDGTLKDLLAVPVRRSSILLAKFSVAFACSAVQFLIIYLTSMLIGVWIQLPGGQPEIIFTGSITLVVIAFLTIIGIFPFALLASIGRGFLLPLSAAMITVMTTNLAFILGWGEYFPWAVPGILAQGKTLLPPISYIIVVLNAAAGIATTILWWKYADQSR